MLTENGTWAHRYDVETKVTPTPPQGPYAIYLTDECRRFRFIVFDLDAKTTSAEQVQQDFKFLTERLDTAGLAYFTAASGSPGALHLWVPVNDPRSSGAPKKLVAQIARAASRQCPSLDKAPLLNPDTGCVRPPGAPHRSGGYSRLVDPQDPVAAAAYCDATANTLGRIKAFADALPAPERLSSSPASSGIIDPTSVQLVGKRRQMTPVTTSLIDQKPENDASAHLAKILTRLALDRWSFNDVLQVFSEQPQAPGFEHVRTQAVGRNRRPRSKAEQRKVLERQWRRQVDYASRLPAQRTHRKDSTEVRALVEVVWSLQQATGMWEWWRSQSGPSDSKALQFVALMALEALSDTLEIDGRRLADQTGMVHSTAARALSRAVKDGRLLLISKGEGRRAHTYRLVLPQDWKVQQVRGDLPVPGGTQGTPRPESCPPQLTRAALLEELQARLAHAAHDLWTSSSSPATPSGLGRHAELTALVLLQSSQKNSPTDPDSLSSQTGYQRATTIRHLQLLEAHELLTTYEVDRLQLHTDRYDQVATALGVAGTRETRMARYELERQVWRWWVSELELLQTRSSDRQPVSLGKRGPRYPRSEQGLPDHTRARTLVAA